VEEQVGECFTTKEEKSPSKMRTTCGHDWYTSYSSFHQSVDDFTYCQIIEDGV
jgi:hypothetical protein